MGRVIKNPDAVFLKNLKRRIKQNNGYCPNKLPRVPENKCPARRFGKARSAIADSMWNCRMGWKHADL